MKNGILIAAMVGLLCCTAGCEAVTEKLQEIKDASMEPEEIVIDYIDNIVEIYNSEQNCGKLVTDLSLYCIKREAVVTNAVKETATRLENNQISPENKAKLEAKKDVLDSMQNPSCDSTIKVSVELLKCTKPALGLFR